MDTITPKLMGSFSDKFNDDSNKHQKVARNAISNSNAKQALLNSNVINEFDHVFSHEIKLDTTISDQSNSGRCWIFSFLNILNFHMISKYDLEASFEFSYSYIYFWDQFEKANYFLRSIIKTRKEPTDSRLIAHLLSGGLQDGGQFHMIRNIIKKYGIVPKSTMNETHQSNNTVCLNELLNNSLHAFAYKIREGKIPDSELEATVEKMLYHIYSILVVFLGQPPKTVEWHYYKQKEEGKGSKSRKSSKRSKSRKGSKGSKGGNLPTHKFYNKLKKLTPQDFFEKVVNFPIDDYVAIANYPHASKPFEKLYTVDYINNMYGKDAVYRFVNLPIDSLKLAAQKSIENKMPVWFCGDISRDSNLTLGILDKSVKDYSNIFDMDYITISKGDRMLIRNAEVSHAMILKGVHSEKGAKPTKWLVENSWGEDTGKKGCYVMSNQWFEEHVYCMVVNKKYLPKNIVKIYNSKIENAVKLDPWDIFGHAAEN